MTILVPITLFGWPLLSVILFALLPSRQAILCIVIGGFLFLPMTGYDLPAIPEYSKLTAISLGLLFGELVYGRRFHSPYRFCVYDLPIFTFCFFSPLATSISNGLELRDGFSNAYSLIMEWGVVYWVGRKYFCDLVAVHELAKAIVVGGLLYVPLCIFELRMSPQLSSFLYGFFAHDWRQQIRYGGYRPIVFMQHGLMVALWMAQSAIAAFWLWRSGAAMHLKGIPTAILVLVMFFVAVLCKSANGWVALSIGILSWLFYSRQRSTWFLFLLLLLPPFYITTRTTMIVSPETVQSVASHFFDEERVYSLAFRMNTEDLLGQKSLERIWFGWGGYGRGWPKDPQTGRNIIQAVDSFWTIELNKYGLVGLISIYSALLLGPWFFLKNRAIQLFLKNGKQQHLYNSTILISLIVIIFAIDTLMNAMISPVCVLCAGALLGNFVSLRHSYAYN